MTGQLHDRPDAVQGGLVEAMNSGVLATDGSGRITEWNPRARELLGHTRDEALGRLMHGLLRPGPLQDPLRPGAESSVPSWRDWGPMRPLRTGVPEYGDGETFVHRDGRPVVCAWSSAPIRPGGTAGDEREPAGLVVVLQDAAERGAVERERRERLAEVRRANARLTLVAEITTVLSSTLDEQEVLRRLVRLVVPALGDWAEADLLISDGRVERAAATHRAMSAADDAGLEGPLPPLPRTPRGPLARVLHDGVTLIVGADDLRPGEPVGTAQDELFRAMDARAAIITPLAARGEIYGALTLGRSLPGHEYEPSDRLVVEDVARRTGLLLANARLFAAQRNTAEAMQRNLLPPLPQPDELQLQARYLPAAQASWVGGDWYDAFALPDGATGLVIGDLVGHDLQAASRMAQLRNMLRALAWDGAGGRPQRPSTVLRRLDDVMAAVSDAELATAVLGRIERTPSGRWRLRWCNAGHPPPLLITRDGDTDFLEEHGALLGAPALTGSRPDGTRMLPPLSTLLLYTDGLVETRGVSLSDRLTGLRRHGALLAPLPLPDLCDRLLERMELSGEDDVALLALRVPA